MSNLDHEIDRDHSGNKCCKPGSCSRSMPYYKYRIYCKASKLHQVSNFKMSFQSANDSSMWIKSHEASLDYLRRKRTGEAAKENLNCLACSMKSSGQPSTTIHITYFIRFWSIAPKSQTNVTKWSHTCKFKKVEQDPAFQLNFDHGIFAPFQVPRRQKLNSSDTGIARNSFFQEQISRSPFFTLIIDDINLSK